MKFEIFVSREKNPDFISRMIMKVTKADFSHIGVLVNGTTVIHAVGEGYLEQSAESFLVKKMFVELHEVKVVNEQYSLGWLHGNLGKDYSQSQFFGFLFPFLRPLLDNNRTKGYCSEFMLDFAIDCLVGGHTLAECDSDWYSPKQTLQKIKELDNE